MVNEEIFKKNTIILIPPNGEIIPVPREKDETNHSQVFLRACKIIPGLLDNFIADPEKSGGYEFSCFLAANNYVIFWPSNINSEDIMIISMPKTPTKDQILNIRKIFPYLKNSEEVYVSICEFKKKNSYKIRRESLSSTGEYEDAFRVLSNYLEKVEMLNDMLKEEEEEVDVSKFLN